MGAGQKPWLLLTCIDQHLPGELEHLPLEHLDQGELSCCQEATGPLFPFPAGQFWEAPFLWLLGPAEYILPALQSMHAQGSGEALCDAVPSVPKFAQIALALCGAAV